MECPERSAWRRRRRRSKRRRIVNRHGLVPFHLTRSPSTPRDSRMPPGREKDSSDRFHPATRKASTTPRGGLFLSISLLLPLRLRLRSLSTLLSATIFSSFRNRLRREDNGLQHRATRRSTRKRSHRSRSNGGGGGNRAVSSFLTDHFARATFARGVLLFGRRRFYRETSTSRNLLPLLRQWLHLS